MQEETSNSSHEVAQLFRTKQHGPPAPSGAEEPGDPGEPGEGDVPEGPEGPEVPEASDGGPQPAPLGSPGSGVFGPGGAFKSAASACPPPPGPAYPLPLPALPALPASSGPDPPRIAPVTFVANKYVLTDKVDGLNFFNCVDVRTREQFVCKVVGREAGALLSAHFRVDGHPSLNSVREVLLGPRHMYLIFPAAHGDLHALVRSRKRLRESEARRFFRQIAEGVRHCHENGIVLRDLKLRKFVFADRHRTSVKLESLEDAVVLDSADDDLLQDKRGCPAYVSPEILRSHAQYSGRAADMWSLGIILYTTLVGRYPFNDTDHASLFAKICRGLYVMPDWLSPRARCLIRSLLRRDPSERLTAQDVLRHPWLQDRHGDDLDLDAGLGHGHADSAADQLVPDVM